MRRCASYLPLAVAAVVVAMLAITAHGATFRIMDTQPVCFVEDISYSSDSVIGRFERKRNPSSDHIAVKFTVTTPKKELLIMSMPTKPGANSFSFKPNAEDGIGFHALCFTVEQWSWKPQGDHDFIQITLTVDHHDRFTIIPAHEPEITRQKVHKTDEVFVFTDFDGQKKETLRTHDYIQRIDRLLSQIALTAEEVANEVKYFEERTIRQRSTTESTFDRVWACAICTMVAMVGVSWVQFSFLKSFLKRKKLV